MQNMGKVICPACANELVEFTRWCWHCGCDLYGMNQVQSKPAAYEIVADGFHFGIALGDEVKIHGLDIENAQSIVAILNRVNNEKD